MQKGDLAFLPSQVILQQFNDNTNTPHAFVKTEKPCHVVVLRALESSYNVLFEGQTWTVPEGCLYPIMEKEDGDSQTHRVI